ncbi:MAG: site-specific DNA-methyltransferase [Kiritimatiellae bacterium]|nr:site-specific DNA-methyltransferase [Kiritimatiellia bacterium]
MSSNTEASGRFHTDWLNMMYPRLKLARNLLRDDGVIFVSLDDGEISTLRLLFNEIFGEDNFAATIIWQKKYAVSNDDPSIGVMHDYIVAFQKSDSFQRGLLPRTSKQLDRYTNPDNDPRGVWSSDNYISNKSREERPTLWYPIRHPKTGEDVWPEEHAVWRYSREKHEQMEAEDRLFWGPDQSYKKPRLKRFLSEIQDGLVPSTWWPFTEVGHNDEAQKETGELLGRKVFNTPKPVRLLSRLILIGSSKDDIVLDFFAGSGTTGHAVMAQNAAEGHTRRYILAQLPEPLDPTNSEQKTAAAFCSALGKRMTIAELTKERLRRAGGQIRDEWKAKQKAKEPDLLTPQSSIDSQKCPDVGFRVFKLDTSNIRAWDPDASNLVDTLDQHLEHLKADRTETDILYELLLKLGLDLCVPIAQRELAGKTVYSIGGGVLFACLTTTITREEVEPLAQGIVAWRKELAPPVGDTTCVFRDSAFADDVAKTNLAAILAQSGLENVRSL